MLILGSKSPRRKEILTMTGIKFKVVPSEIGEDVCCSDPYEYPQLTALKKAEALRKIYPDELILCCDTVVIMGDKILEKPVGKKEAYDMIRLLQNGHHRVVTGVYLGKKEKIHSYRVITDVYVGAMTEGEIKAYIETDEPYDKAGGYAVQGFFARYIEKIEGDYYNVMGLPIHSVWELLKEFEENL